MTPSPAIPLDYERLRDSLVAAGAVVAPAELHGGVCGALCARGVEAARRWIADVFHDEQHATASAAVTAELEEIIGASVKMLEEGELEFRPLLPDDDTPLAEQVEALAAWCHGFLNGLGSSAPAGVPESDALGEIVRDFAEISRAGLSDEEAEGQGQPDFALAQIQEYVRVSVQVVFEELAAQRADPPPDVH